MIAPRRFVALVATTTIAALLAAGCAGDTKPASTPASSAVVTIDSTVAPATTESATTEPATTIVEPATTESATTEPATTEPATTEPATTEPATTEPATTEPATTEPATTEPAPTEPATTVPATTDPATTVGTAAITTAPFPIASLTDSFVDPTRPTAATAASPELPTRTIETTIVYPVGPGPFPLIVLSHGLTGLPSRLTRISGAWAAAGYVVAMPAFPMTNGAVPSASANLADVVNQPADVSFVIDQVLALNTDDGSPLFGRVDADHIGVAGHSLGAATTYGVALNSCCLDTRITAVVILAGFTFIDIADNGYSRPIPFLIVHGDADPVLDIGLDQGVYDRLAGPKWFITLIGGSHSTGIEDLSTKYDPLVDTATTDFWNAYLRAGDPQALAALRSDAVVPGLSTLQSNQ